MAGFAEGRMRAAIAAEDHPFTYIAGPMTGYPEYNEPAFKAMAKRLRDVGILVISPNELHAPDPDKSREWYLRRDLEAVVRHCKRVVFLVGWERSWGATLEHTVARELGLELVYPHELEGWLMDHLKNRGWASEAAAASRHADEQESERLLNLVGNCPTSCTGDCCG